MSESRLWPSEDERGVSSPVVVLISVAMFSLALSMYMGYSESLVDMGQSERDVSEPTLERVSDNISDDGAYNEDEGLENALAVDVLPQGRDVFVAITYVNDSGGTELVDHVKFAADGTTSSYSETPMPGHVNASSRPIGVRYGPQDVRGGRLHVGVV